MTAPNALRDALAELRWARHFPDDYRKCDPADMRAEIRRLRDGIKAAHELAAQPAPEGVSLTDEQIVEIRDEHLPSQGDSFDCIAFARAVIRAALAAQPAPEGVSLTDEPADFTAWWESMAPAPYYPGIERRIALNAWRAALAIQGAGK